MENENSTSLMNVLSISTFDRNMNNYQNFNKMLHLRLTTKEKTAREMIAETKVATAIAEKNITEMNVTREKGIMLKDLLSDMKTIQQMLPIIESIYTEDLDNSPKCLISALKEPKYKQKLKQYNATIRRQANRNENTLLQSYICHDLSSNIVEIRATFKVIKNGVNVVIANLEKNNVENVENLTFMLSILITRLYELYNIYSYYLIDIGYKEECKIVANKFKNILEIFKQLNCINILLKRKED